MQKIINTFRQNFLSSVVICIFILVITPQSQAATKKLAPSSQTAQKERVVLMPLRLGDDDKKLQGAIETAVVEGLEIKYVVFSGEQVSKKAREIFNKESRNLAHTECDETRCLQRIAESFQAELLAIVSVTKDSGGYFIALSIRNLYDNKDIYSKSLPCKGCDSFALVDKLKELVGTNINIEAYYAALSAARIAKAEELKQEQSAFEEKLRNSDEVERKRLLNAKAEDDNKLASLKVLISQRRNSTATINQTDFPTYQSAVDQIVKLNESIQTIQSSYEKELSKTRNQVIKRYTSRLNALNKLQRDEFETSADFSIKQANMREDLIRQRDAELARLNTETIAANELLPLRTTIKSLSERIYTLSEESLVVNLGKYDADGNLFPTTILSKIPSFTLNISGTLSLPIEGAKSFKQQWVAGLIRGEAKVTPTGKISEISLVNDADNKVYINHDTRFFSSDEWKVVFENELETKLKKQKLLDDAADEAAWTSANETKGKTALAQMKSAIVNYLNRFPSGKFISEANARLQVLNSTEEPTFIDANGKFVYYRNPDGTTQH